MRRFRDKPDISTVRLERLRERAGPAGGRGGPRRGARSPRPRPRRSRLRAGDAGRLADRVGQRLEVVAGGQQRPRVRGEPQDLPAAGGGEPAAVLLAEVVAVRLGVRRQRAEHRRRVGVHIGERGHGRTPTGGPRTASDQAHVRTLPTRDPRDRPPRRSRWRSPLAWRRAVSRERCGPPGRGVQAACPPGPPRARPAWPAGPDRSARSGSPGRSGSTTSWPRPSPRSRRPGGSSSPACRSSSRTSRRRRRRARAAPPRRCRLRGWRASRSDVPSRPRGDAPPGSSSIAVRWRLGQPPRTVEDLVRHVVVGLVAELLGLDPDDVDPDGSGPPELISRADQLG